MVDKSGHLSQYPDFTEGSFMNAACNRTLRLARSFVALTAFAVFGSTLMGVMPPGAHAAPANVVNGKQAALLGASRQAAAAGHDEVVDALTTETQQVTAHPDGSFSMEAAVSPVRAKVDGQWQATDTTLHRNADGSLAPTVAAADISLSGGGTTQPLAAVSSDGADYSLSWPDPLPTPTLSGPTATYPNVLPDVDLTVTATTTGFSEVLVVKTAAAASNADVQSISLTAHTAAGTIHPAPDGSTTVTTSAGAPAIGSSPPTMWDSSPVSQAGPQTSPVSTGSGDVVPVVQDVDTAADGHSADITLTPPTTALTGPGVTYPVYIDPSATGGRQAFAEVTSNGWHYFNDPNWNPKTGYCNWSGCNGAWVGRALMQFDISQALGGTGPLVIGNTTVWLRQIHNAAGCTSEPVDLLAANAFNADTRWPGPVGAVLAETSSNAGDTCGGPGTVAFNTSPMDQYVHDALLGGRPDIAFALKAPNESDKYQWKQFDNSVLNSGGVRSNLLTFNFNYAPQTPAGLRLDGQVSCNGDGMNYTGSANPTFHSATTDGNPSPQTIYTDYAVYPGNGRNNTVPSGTTMPVGTAVATSVPGTVSLNMQGDGNLVLYARGTALWSTQTFGTGFYAIIQTDGNLVVYNASGQYQWASNTYGNPGAFLGVQSDGNLVLYAQNGGPVWSTGTHAPLGNPVAGANNLAAASGADVPWTENATALGAGSYVVSAVSRNGTSDYPLTLQSPLAGLQFEKVDQPSTPVVTSTNVAPNNWTPRSGTFTLKSTGDVVGFAYAWTGAVPPLQGNTDCTRAATTSTGGRIPANPDGTATLPIDPALASGPYSLVVTAINHANATSAPSVPFRFYTGRTDGNGADGSAAVEGESSTLSNLSPSAITACAVCSGGQQRVLGNAATAAGAAFDVPFSVGAEADYALGLWLTVGTDRATFRITLDSNLSATALYANSTTTASGAAPDPAQPLVISGYRTGPHRYYLLGGLHLPSGSHTLHFVVQTPASGDTPSANQIGFDRFQAVAIANVTSANLTAAMNNTGMTPDGANAANFGPWLDDPTPKALSQTAMRGGGFTPGSTVTYNGWSFVVPAVNSSGADNVIADGQTIALPPSAGIKHINLLVASTCGDSRSGSSILFTESYQDASTIARFAPTVPDWLSGSYSGPVTNGQNVTLARVDSPYPASYYNDNSAAQNQSPQLFTLSLPALSTKTLSSITLPNYGGAFSCAAGPQMHVLAVATSTA